MEHFVSCSSPDVPSVRSVPSNAAGVTVACGSVRRVSVVWGRREGGSGTRTPCRGAARRERGPGRAVSVYRRLRQPLRIVHTEHSRHVNDRAEPAGSHEMLHETRRSTEKGGDNSSRRDGAHEELLSVAPAGLPAGASAASTPATRRKRSERFQR